MSSARPKSTKKNPNIVKLAEALLSAFPESKPLPRSYELPQTTRNRETADKVDALLIEAETLGVPYHLRTRRQARKMLQGRGTLRTEMLTLRRLIEQQAKS